MALAEMGYPPECVTIREKMVGITLSLGIDVVVPKAVAWMAMEMAHTKLGTPHTCWPCAADNNTAIKCARGNCSHPGEPRKPSKELLVRGNTVQITITDTDLTDAALALGEWPPAGGDQ